MRKMLLAIPLALAGCVYERVAREPAAPSGPPVTREEMERLSAAGVSEPVLIELVEKRGARPVSADDLVALKKAGASDAVVQKMIASETKEPEVVLVEQPTYYYPRPYYPHPWYYDPWYCYPSIGFGFGYHSHRRHRHSGVGVRIIR
jgi:hypothetical protein